MNICMDCNYKVGGKCMVNSWEPSSEPKQCNPEKRETPEIRYTGETVTLTTYANNTDDEDPGREFTIPTDYAREKIAKWFNQSLEVFLTEYTWDWTIGWPEMAKAEGVLL